jgi:hypothetical protein
MLLDFRMHCKQWLFAIDRSNGPDESLMTREAVAAKLSIAAKLTSGKSSAEILSQYCFCILELCPKWLSGRPNFNAKG